MIIRFIGKNSLSWLTYVSILLIFTALLYLITFSGNYLADATDSSHAIAAREILQRDDWITLHINGVRYLEKAPLLYWLTAISYQCFGINEFAVRVPTVVTIVLLAGTTYLFGRWAYSEKAGLYGAIILVSCVGMFLFTRIMIPEVLLTLWFTVAHFCFLQAFLGKGKEKLGYYGFYGAMALAVLSKGLIGIVFCIFPAFFFVLLTGSLKLWREFRLGSGMVVFLAIALPWHLLVGLHNEDFFWFYFINEHLLRFLNLRPQRDYNRLPIIEYWLLHLLWLFPWSLGLPLLFKQRFRPQERHSQINLYLLLWAVTILVFFALSSNQEYYTFPAYPALALLLGAAFVNAESQSRRFLLRMNQVLAAIALMFAAILGILVWNSRQVQPVGDVSVFLKQVAADSEEYTRFLGRFFDLTGKAMAELRLPAIGAALALSLGFLLALWLRRSLIHRGATVCMLVAMWFLFICASYAHLQFEPVLSSRTLAEEIMERWQPNAKIVINGNHEIASSIGFYTDQQLLLLNGRKFNLAFGSRYPDAPPIFISDEDIRRLWLTNNPIFLVTETIKKDTLLKNLDLPAILIDERGSKSLFTNRELVINH